MIPSYTRDLGGDQLADMAVPGWPAGRKPSLRKHGWLGSRSQQSFFDVNLTLWTLLRYLTADCEEDKTNAGTKMLES